MAITRLSLLATVLGLASTACGGGAPRPPATPAAAADNLPGGDAVRVDLYARDDERWTLRRGDESYVCTLPCSYWARSNSGLVIRLEGTTPTVVGGIAERDTSFELPALLPANPNERLTVTVDRTHGFGTTGKIVAAPLAVIFGLMGVAFTGIGIASLATGSKDTTTSASGCVSANDPQSKSGVTGCTTTTSHGTAASIGAIAVGVGALAAAVLSTMWFLHDREGGLRYEGPPASAATASTRGSAVRVELGGAGLVGTF